ncbi:MAG: hypothetical protein RL259_581 [Bacteroidota bacterium]|jgi:hypothetical protein
MGWFNKKKITLTAVKDKKVAKVDELIDKYPSDRIKESLQDYANAVIDAENPLLPESLKYEALLSLYKNIELDEHVSSLIDTVVFELTQTNFDILNANKEKDDDKKALFQRSWFNDFIRYWFISKLYPFGAIQFTGISQGSYSGCDLIDINHVRPKAKGVAKYEFDEDIFIDYSKKPWYDWILPIKSDKHLGLFSVISKLFIMKRDVRQFWAVYNELFTTPYYIVKTDFNNSKHRQNLLDWLGGRKHSGFATVDLNDEIQALTTNGTGYQSYKDFEDSMNKGMSKAIIGQTMTNEDGSSRSQAQVHENTKNAFINAYLTDLEYVINEQVIPRMQAVGIEITTDFCFKYSREHSMTPIEWADVVNKLGAYKVSDDDIMDKIGLEVEEREQQPAFSEGKVKAVYEQIKAQYNGI